MAQIKYASDTTLQALATKIKALLGTKVDKKVGWDLSQNDLTNELKGQYDAAYTHSQAAHAPANAEKNTIINIKVNGAQQSIDPTDRFVDITMPTKVSDLNNDSNFQTDTQVSSAITTALEDYYDKGETDSKIAAAVAAASHLKRQIVEELPSTEQDENTIYMVLKAPAGSGNNLYDEYMWLNSAWEKIGDTAVDLTDYITTSKLTEALAPYAKTADFVAITSGEIDTMFE